MSIIFASMMLAAVAQSPAPPIQQDIPTLAQALDRCMATYAVRMASTDSTDDAIYAAATDGCRSIEIELMTAVRRQVPAAQADAAIQQWSAQARPNFIALLERIRRDRAGRVQR